MYGITKLLNITKNINNIKIIIVENNGKRGTILDNLGCDVYYTMNNFLPTSNIGYKELQDIFDCITNYNILDSDFIIKMTGRYIIEENSEFISIINKISNNKIDVDCVIKYGSYFKPVDYKMKDCITGLIGMKCKYIKQIEYPNNNDSVEWNWAKTTYLMDDNKIIKVDKLGINICPGGNNYFLV
jgi:hypothetical protein